jgi:hypothetical protein
MMNKISSCDCETPKRSPATPTEFVPLAIATVPMQPWEQPYDPAAALKNGTIFPCLNLPFYVTGGDL